MMGKVGRETKAGLMNYVIDGMFAWNMYIFGKVVDNSKKKLGIKH